MENVTKILISKLYLKFILKPDFCHKWANYHSYTESGLAQKVFIPFCTSKIMLLQMI